jgi:hypothetical protein
LYGDMVNLGVGGRLVTARLEPRGGQRKCAHREEMPGKWPPFFSASRGALLRYAALLIQPSRFFLENVPLLGAGRVLLFLSNSP